jgi:hypothetical protein
MSNYKLVTDKLQAEGWGAWDWLINEFIPSMGHDHMCKFIELGFEPVAYCAWLWTLENSDKPFTAELNKALLERTERLHNERENIFKATQG